MPNDLQPTTVRLSNRPLYSLIVQFPAVCFVGTLLTDIAYLRTEVFIWETFSVWLLAVGCVTAAIAGLIGLIDFIRDPRLRRAVLAWPHALASLAVALLSVVNVFVHSRDGYTAVVPTGLTLSAIVVLLMILTTWLGSSHLPRNAHTGVTA